MPALVLCASNSWPSFSRLDSPFVLGLAIGTWFCYKASIFAFQGGLSSAFHRDRPDQRWRRRPSNLQRSSHGEGLFESACFLGRCPICLEPARRGKGLEYVGCAKVVPALVWVLGMTAGSRGWRV